MNIKEKKGSEPKESKMERPRMFQGLSSAGLCRRETKERGSGKSEGWMRPTQQDQGERGWGGVRRAKDTKAQYM